MRRLATRIVARALALVLSSGAITACVGPPAGRAAAPEPSHAAPAAEAVTEPTLAPPTEAPPAPALAPLPPALSRPMGVSCRFTSAAYASRGPVSLRIARGGAELGWFNPGLPVVLTFGVGSTDETSAFAEVTGHALALEGHADPSRLTLLPSRGVLLGPLIPKARTALRWTAGREREATVTLDEPGAHLSTPATATLPCDALSLDVVRFDPLDGLAGVTNRRVTRWLAAHRKITVSDAPLGKPLATLDPDDERLAVELAREGDYAHVAIELEDAYLVGYVPTRWLSDHNGDRGSGLLGSRGRTRGRTGVLESRVCDRAVPLVAELGGERFTVGAAQPGAQIDLANEDAPFASVWVADDGVVVAEGVRLLARRAELDACPLAPAKAPITSLPARAP